MQRFFSFWVWPETWNVFISRLTSPVASFSTWNDTRQLFLPLKVAVPLFFTIHAIANPFHRWP